MSILIDMMLNKLKTGGENVNYFKHALNIIISNCSNDKQKEKICKQINKKAKKLKINLSDYDIDI